MSFFMKNIGNPFIKLILQSPLHTLMSKSTAVISVTGKISGKNYSFPVNYLPAGNTIWITSMRDRSWWKNLRGGAKVSLLLAGRDCEGQGEVFEDTSEIAKYLTEYLLLRHAYAKYFEVGLDPEGKLILEDLNRASEERVMVRVILS